jgi:hypothetical protein
MNREEQRKFLLTTLAPAIIQPEERARLEAYGKELEQTMRAEMGDEEFERKLNALREELTGPKLCPHCGQALPIDAED